MEHSISSIVSKIDAVLSKMDVITHQENNTEAETTTEVRFLSFVIEQIELFKINWVILRKITFSV